MPIAKPDTARTPRGVPVVIAVLSNDQGGSLTVAGYTLPTAGTLLLNPDQTFTYTPTAAFEGVDGFAYTVRDSVGGTSEGEVRIFVARPNTAPVAANDAAAVQIGSAATIPVLANDNDPDGDPISIIGIDAPAHGTITVLPDQSIRYVPQAEFVGIDSFTYTIGDGQGGMAEASVTVTVSLPNRPPVARSDRATTVEGTAATIDVLANDNDPDGDPISLAGMEMPGQGSLALTAENRFTYTPRPGFVGVDSFSYTIRDSAGATARADVTVEVAARNAAPTAVADSLTSSGQPVAFDPLANDSDPDGDTLHLKSLTMPMRGRVEVGADGRVTYTPPAGFTGTDGFTYQVGDGTDVGEAEVSVAVTAPAVPTYANGYRYRRRIMVPAQATAAEVATDFVVLIQETGTWLKPASAGGRLQHAQGFDIRLELEAGTKLDHEIEYYDATAGSLTAWARIPSYELASQLRLFLYYGKPGLTAPEANPAGTWRGYLAVIDARTGVDRSGRGRSLTPSGIGAGALIGPAGSYGGASVASRGDAGFLSGQSALTVQTVTLPDATMIGSDHGVLAQGPMDRSDASAGLILQYLAQSTDGTANVVHFKVNCADGAAFVLSGAQTQTANRQLLHGVWSQGGTARLFLNGSEVDPSAASASRAGLTSMPAGGLFLGAGARDTAAGGWRGVIDDVRIAGTALSPARIAAEAANLSAQQALYGLGGEDGAGEPDAAPTAVPLRARTVAANSVDIDVLASAYDPDGPAPTVSSVGTAAHGVVTVVGGKVRYTPFAGYVGADAFAYTLESGGKRSTSLVQVTVAADPAIPKLPPAAVRTLRVPEDYATPALALAAARPGDHVSLADGTYGDNVSVSVNGSSAGYVVIKARNHCMAAISGHWNVTGDWIWFTGLTAARPGTDPDPNKNRAFETPSFYSWRLAGKRNRVTNCRIDSPNGIWINSDAGFRTEYVDICFNDFTGRTEPRWNQANCIYMGRFATNSAGCNNVLIARNRWYDDLAFTDATSDNAETRFCIYTGNSHPDDNNVGVNRSVRIWENYVNIRYIGRGFYTKRTYDYRRNYISVNSGGGTLQSFNLRHGGYSRADGTAFTNPPLTDNTRGWIEGNNFANGKVIVNDSDHLWLGNRFAKNVEFYYGGQRWEFESATNTWRASAAEGYVQAAKRNIFVGCTFGGSLILGEDEGTSGKPYKLAADQGGAIAGVINYGAGIANQPSETNGKLVRRRDWNNGATINSFQPSDAGQLAVLAGTAGYRLDAAGNGGYAPVSYVVADDLESSTGCDPLS